jgi:hypothetical protein
MEGTLRRREAGSGLRHAVVRPGIRGPPEPTGLRRSGPSGRQGVSACQALRGAWSKNRLSVSTGISRTPG